MCVVNTVFEATASRASSNVEAALATRRAHALEREERGVALVDVQHRRLACPSARERAHAADAEHDLLPQPRLVVAAVEEVRDVAVALGSFSGRSVSSR